MVFIASTTLNNYKCICDKGRFYENIFGWSTLNDHTEECLENNSFCNAINLEDLKTAYYESLSPEEQKRLDELNKNCVPPILTREQLLYLDYRK